jgi:O-antigen/teichoic acid export membrane protein
MIKRIVKMFGALGTGMGITVLTQFLLPPAFLHYYGVSGYGEWLVLSGTLSYLSSLRFGITTYASNELTILNKRGDMDGYRKLQGSTLALLLGTIGIGLFVSSSVFFLPVVRLFHLSTIGQADARLAGFFLGLQAMANILASYYNNLFMVVQAPHRGWNWYNALRLAGTLISLPLAVFRVSFSTMAIGQFAAVLAVALLTVYDLKRRMGVLPLGLSGANWKTARAALTPSGMFAMIWTQQFLLFQAPLILLQWILGPATVVLFSIGRTVLSTARQLLQSITWAIAPEITFSFAERDKEKMLSIFHYSEKAVFAVIPVANLGAFLLSPVLLSVWLHQPGLFDLHVYALLAVISGAMSMREHKQFFQFQTNTHKRLALIVFFGNILMIAVSVPSTLEFGLFGFLVVWLVSEIAQMGLIYVENKKLFGNDPSISLVPVVKLGMAMLLSLPICAALLHYSHGRSSVCVGAIAMGGIAILSAESYFLFGIGEVWARFRSRKRVAATGASLAV